MNSTTPPTFEQRVSAIEHLGYTRREAEFLVLAALHSGYFLRRQFSSLRGKRNDDLCRKLLLRGHGDLAFTAGRVQVFHIYGKPFYQALTQDDNRHRRKHESFYIRGKLMLLDYVLAHREARFLPTEEEKIAYFHGARKLPLAIFPSRTYIGRNGEQTVRYFVDKFPIRAGDRVQFGFVDDGLSRSAFRLWLSRIEPLVRALGRADIVYITASANSVGNARKEFGRRFQAPSAALESYFELRHDIESSGLNGRPQDVLDQYRKWQRQYSGERYEQQYAAWIPSKKTGAANDVSVTFSTHLLPFQYSVFGSVAAGEESNVGVETCDAQEIATFEGGCVVFVESADRQFIKITFSKRVIRRIAQLGPLGPTAGRPTILGYIPGSYGTELWLRAKFAADRDAGDWFRASTVLREFIASVGPLPIEQNSVGTNGGGQSAGAFGSAVSAAANP